MTLDIDFLSSPFVSELISSNKNKKVSYGSLKCQKPIQFASSNTHSLFINNLNQLYGFGSNLHHQISSKNLPLFSLPIQVDLVTENALILEIACGENFSAVYTDKQEIEIFGNQKCKIQKNNIRGISASNNTLAFAFEINSVYIGKIDGNSKKKELPNTIFELPAPILKTAINDSSVAALDQNGNVHVHEFGSDSFATIPNIHGSAISASHDSITILNNNTIYVYKSESKTITSHFLPNNFKCVFACSSFSDIFAIGEDGRVCHGFINETELSTYSKQYQSIQKCIIDRLNSVGSISMSGNSTIFIKGNPDQFNYEFLPKIVPLKPSTTVKTANFNDTFICCTDKTAYFKSLTIPYSKLPTILSQKRIDGAAYFTAALEPIELEDDQDKLKKLNLSIGDTLKLKRKGIEIGDIRNKAKEKDQENSKRNSRNKDNDDNDDGCLLFEVVGVSDGKIWGRPFKSNYVFCLPSDNNEFNEIFEIVEKPNTEFQNCIVNGRHAQVDISPSSVEELGYSIGDLIWHPTHGIVEVIGRSCFDIVLLEFCNRTLFTHEAVEMQILRKSENSESLTKSDKSQKKSKKAKSQKMSSLRKVVDVNGEVISLDISSGGGPRIFLPTDRVLSPLGEATVIGFDDTPYIQTDEMRMNGYEAVSVDIFDLQLIRRINGVAERTVNLSKSSSIKVSLNTEDSPNSLLPGDKLQIREKFATVVGFHNDDSDGTVKTVIKYKGAKYCSILESPSTIIYRAEINALRKSSSTPSAFVGSPFISESAFLPGDVLFNKDIGEAVYIGYIKDHVVFLLTKSDEIITFGFSLLMLPDFFEVVKRPVLDFWND